MTANQKEVEVWEFPTAAPALPVEGASALPTPLATPATSSVCHKVTDPK